MKENRDGGKMYSGHRDALPVYNTNVNGNEIRKVLIN